VNKKEKTSLKSFGYLTNLEDQILPTNKVLC